MELPQDIKTLLTGAKNICIIPSYTNEPESLSAALALFYTLKQLGKNVNLIQEAFPEKLSFLIPSLDYITQPKNFVISIPRSVADVSQVYYEKNEENLKIHLTINKGTIKKDTVSFYFADAKPDIIITLGIRDFRKELEGKLDSFGYLMDSPIINIDNHQDNNKFGKINMVEEKSLPEILLEIIKSFETLKSPLATVEGGSEKNGFNKNTATCLLTALTVYYENFQHPKTTSHAFELCAQLMKQGANRAEITENLYPKKDFPISTKKEEQLTTSL